MKNWLHTDNDVLQITAHRIQREAAAALSLAQDLGDDAQRTTGQLDDPQQTTQTLHSLEQAQAALYKANALLEVARSRIECSTHCRDSHFNLKLS